MAKILIGIPCTEMIPVEFFRACLGLNRKHDMAVMPYPNSLVHAARDDIAKATIEGKYDYLCFIDSDMVFGGAAVDQLVEDGKDIVTGLYFKRKYPYSPVLYKTIGGEEEEGKTGGAIPYVDYPRNAVFRCEAAGAGMLLIRREVLEDVYAKTGKLFEPFDGLGEDFSFNLRAKRCGWEMWCDSRVVCGHIGKLIVDDKLFDQLYASLPEGTEDKSE